MSLRSGIESRLGRRFYHRARGAKVATNTRVSHSVVIPWATYSPWNDDTEFLTTHQKIQHNTLVDIYRCHELWSLVRETSHLRGDILEVGVWRGGTGCLMAAQASRLEPSTTVFLCDTFKGVVKAGIKDSVYRGGEHADTFVDVVHRLKTGMGLSNVQLLEGIFPDATGEQVNDRQFSLCHIDVDVYESAKDVLEWVWPRLVRGGVIVYDDYGFFTCEGVTSLVNEHLQGPGAITLHNLNGHAVVVKID
jgi:O-methyltransferase